MSVCVMEQQESGAAATPTTVTPTMMATNARHQLAGTNMPSPPTPSAVCVVARAVASAENNNEEAAPAPLPMTLPATVPRVATAFPCPVSVAAPAAPMMVLSSSSAQPSASVRLAPSPTLDVPRTAMLVRELRDQLEATRAQLRSQESRTGMLELMVDAQRQFNEDQIKVNMMALQSRSRQSTSGPRTSSSSRSSSSGRTLSSPGASSSCSSRRHHWAEHQSLSRCSSLATELEVEDDGCFSSVSSFSSSSVTSIATRGEREKRSNSQESSKMTEVASIPIAAVTAVDRSMRPLLLRREDDVNRVIKSLLREQDRCSCGADNSVSDGDQDSVKTRYEELPDEHSCCTDIFHPSSFHTVLTGPPGSGKTTLAALAVSSRPDVLSRFRDGIGWITVPQSPSALDCDEYAECLRDLCAQLDIPPPRSLDGGSIADPGGGVPREHKKRRAMEVARQEMVNALSGRAVLIVLDDLWRLDDAEWFAFGRSPASEFRMLVTTRRRVSDPTAAAMATAESRRSETFTAVRGIGTAVTLGGLPEDEAVRMLLAQSTSKACSESERAAAAKIVRMCGCLPVALQWAGSRLFGRSRDGSAALSVEDLAAVMSAEREDLACDNVGRASGTSNTQYVANDTVDTAGKTQRGKQRSRSVDSSLKTFSTHDFGDGDVTVYETIGRSLSPGLHGSVIATAMKVCLATFAATFSRLNCELPLVPTAVICSFWERLLLPEERDAIRPRNRRQEWRAESGSGVNAVAACLLEEMEALGLMRAEKVEIPIGESVSCSDDERSCSKSMKTVLSYRLERTLTRHYALYLLFNDGDLGSEVMERRLRANGLRLGMSMSSKVRAITARCQDRLRVKRSSLSERREQDKGRLIQGLHSLVTENYGVTKRGKLQEDGLTGLNDDGYVFEHLPLHLTKDVLDKNTELLRNNGFNRSRMLTS